MKVEVMFFRFVGNVIEFFLVIVLTKLLSQSMHITIYCREIVFMYLMLKYHILLIKISL